MKKICLLITAVFLFNLSSVVALNSKYQTSQPSPNTLSKGIIEDIEVYNNKRVIDSITATYTIPKNYKGDITIVSGIFDALSASDGYVPADGVKVNVKVINNSNYEYNYVNNSFILATEDLDAYNLKKIEGAVGFNGKQIYEPFAPYRTGNTAIQNLYDVQSTSKIKENMVKTEALDTKLKEKGYKGINELNKYYLDFYNKKYNQHVTNLEDFSSNIISEIFNGNCLYVKETNPNLAALGYDYWYNKLFSLNFIDEVNNDNISEKYAIGNHMRGNTNSNSYFQKDIGHISLNSAKTLTEASLRINGKYTTNAFMNYNFSAYLEFKLKMEEPKDKEDNSEEIIYPVVEDDIIIPPKTGI